MKYIRLYAVAILVETKYANNETVIIKDENSKNYAIYTDRIKAENFRQYMADLYPDETYIVVNSGLTSIE